MPPAILWGMDEQRDITRTVDRLETELRHEVIYVRGYAAMHRERYIEYLRDLRKARWSKDYERADAIIDDLRTFAAEARGLQRKGNAAYGRLAGLVAERGFAAPGELPALRPDPHFTQASSDEDEIVQQESTSPERS